MAVPRMPRVTPYLLYEDATRMADWLVGAFGLRQQSAMKDSHGKVVHAEMWLGEDGLVLIGAPVPPFKNPKHLGQATANLYVYVEDVDAHCEQARKCGARIIEEPLDTEYGDRRYGAEDPEGHRWYFAKTRAAQS